MHFFWSINLGSACLDPDSGGQVKCSSINPIPKTVTTSANQPKAIRISARSNYYKYILNIKISFNKFTFQL